MARVEKELEDIISDLLVDWMPKYEDINGKQMRIVDVGRDGERIYEVRDHNDGQAIVGRYRVHIIIEKIGE